MNIIPEHYIESVEKEFKAATDELKKAQLALEDAKSRYERAHYAKHCPHKNIIYKGGFTHIEEQCNDCKFIWYT